MRNYDIGLESQELCRETLRSVDAVVIVTDHRAIDWELVAEASPLIIDTRDAIRKHAKGKIPSGKVVHA